MIKHKSKSLFDRDDLGKHVRLKLSIDLEFLIQDNTMGQIDRLLWSRLVWPLMIKLKSGIYD